jgi:hypothetical protein
LLIASLIVLGLQLPFELVPLIRFNADRTKMGRYANVRWLNVVASIVAGMIIAFDLRLIAAHCNKQHRERVALDRAPNERGCAGRLQRGRVRTAYASRSLRLRFSLYSTRGATGSARGEGGT